MAQAIALDVPQLFQNLATEFDEDLLRRAAIWMTLRESKASFAIEGEADHANRIERFADVMARQTGQGDCPLTDTALAQLQGDILGKRNTRANNSAHISSHHRQYRFAQRLKQLQQENDRLIALLEAHNIEWRLQQKLWQPPAETAQRHGAL